MLRNVVVALIAAATLLLAPDPAAAEHRGYPVAGELRYCRDSQGMPVLIAEDPRLDNVGVAKFYFQGDRYVPLIVFNPRVLRPLDPRVQLFWFAHECAHHAFDHVRWSARTGMQKPYAEMEADCQAARALRWGYGLSLRDIEVVAWSVVRLPGSAAGHLPGPQRAQHIMHCAAD
jgi:hypothetical protein